MASGTLNAIGVRSRKWLSASMQVGGIRQSDAPRTIASLSRRGFLVAIAVERVGTRYRITEMGREYLARVGGKV